MERLFSMLCASGFEFEKKLRLAMAELESAERALQSVSELNENSSKRFENATKRYNKRLSDFMNHKRVCTLCRESLSLVPHHTPVHGERWSIRTQSGRLSNLK